MVNSGQLGDRVEDRSEDGAPYTHTGPVSAPVPQGDDVRLQGGGVQAGQERTLSAVECEPTDGGCFSWYGGAVRGRLYVRRTTVCRE